MGAIILIFYELTKKVEPNNNSFFETGFCMKQFLIIALLSFLALVPQSTVCMDLGRAEQESPEQREESSEQARGHDHPLMEHCAQDQKNLEEIIEVLSQSKELLQGDLYHEDCSNKPAAPVAQPGPPEDMEMWLTGRLHWAEPDGIIVIIDE